MPVSLKSDVAGFLTKIDLKKLLITWCFVPGAASMLVSLILRQLGFSTWMITGASIAALCVFYTAVLRSMILRNRADNVRFEAAKHERDMLRTLIDSLPDFIYVKDRDCRFLLANRFCCEAMGTTLEELLGRSDFDFYSPEIAKNFFDDEQSVIVSGTPLMSRQEEVVDQMGRSSTILTTKVPYRDATGSIVGIMGIGRNITARVAAETQLRAAQSAAQIEMRERERILNELRLAQKLESVGRLAAGLAHEINTPIQYVGDSVHFLRSAFADLSALFTAYKGVATQNHTAAEAGMSLADLKALETSLDLEFLSAEVPRAFERTVDGIDRVAGIVRAMKEFAHPDTTEQKAADINRALNTTLAIARSEYRHAAQIHTQYGELPEVVCNIGELNQVFLNLIVNAAHAIADSGKDNTTGQIAITTRVVENCAEIIISDNGCGIRHEHLDKIFDPFFTTKEVGRGTGQGLAIARSIVTDKHAGRIDVESEVGQGTRFIICVPLVGRATGEVHRAAEPAHERGVDA